MPVKVANPRIGCAQVGPIVAQKAPHEFGILVKVDLYPS
jgi:hypothetical protein